MSKISRALQIFNENKGVDRKEVIKSIAFVLGVTNSNASVYYYKCVKMSQEESNEGESPVIEEVKIVEKTPSKKVPYDYGDAVPDFIKKSWEKRHRAQI